MEDKQKQFGEENKIEMRELIVKVRNKIATWHNGDKEINGEKEEPNGQNLLLLSQEVVEDVLNEAASQLGAQTKSGVEMDEEATKEKIKENMENQQQEEETQNNSSKKNNKGFFNLFNQKK